MKEMHDWTLKDIQFEWLNSRVTFHFEAPEGSKYLIADGVRDLHIPQKNDWGQSVSVNGAKEDAFEGGLRKLILEMQSGDVLEVVAAGFSRT